MKITKVSQLTGKENTLDIKITQEELNRVENRFANCEHIQNILPSLEMGEREFLISGITPKEWNETFG